MPIAFRGRGSVASGTGNGPYSPGLPAGLEPGDQLLLVISLSTGEWESFAALPWGSIDLAVHPSASLRRQLLVLTSSGQGAPSVTLTGESGAVSMSIYAWSGVDQTTPLDAVGSRGFFTGTQPSAPTVITTVADTVVLAILGADADVAVGFESGSNVVDRGQTSGLARKHLVGDRPFVGPGSSGSVAFEANSWSGIASIGQQIAWRRAVVATVPVAPPRRPRRTPVALARRRRRHDSPPGQAIAPAAPDLVAAPTRRRRTPLRSASVRRPPQVPIAEQAPPAPPSYPWALARLARLVAFRRMAGRRLDPPWAQQLPAPPPPWPPTGPSAARRRIAARRRAVTVGAPLGATTPPPAPPPGAPSVVLAMAVRGGSVRLEVVSPVAHTGIDIGDRLALAAEFRLPPTPSQAAAGLPGDLANPTTVALALRRPNGALTVVGNAGLSNPSVGRWELEVDIDLAGLWQYRYAATGSIVCADETTFVVRPSAFF